MTEKYIQQRQSANAVVKSSTEAAPATKGKAMSLTFLLASASSSQSPSSQLARQPLPKMVNIQEPLKQVTSSTSSLVHLQEVVQERQQAASKTEAVVINGEDLTLGSFMALVRDQTKAQLDNDAKQQVDFSVESLRNRLLAGENIYGVTTGFGGSADVNTTDYKRLQEHLIDFLGVGFNKLLPKEAVRGFMAIRANTNIRGHSALSWNIIERVVAALNANVTPCVPECGSISASGDLIPLSYLAGLLTGSPSVEASLADGSVVTSEEALKVLGYENASLNAKEGLALVNGTSVCCSLACINAFDSLVLCQLTQALTGMAVEALHGTKESFFPFIGAARPHPGQIAVANNIRQLLEDSKLCSTFNSHGAAGAVLRQDRYAVRTSPQWIGPHLETIDSVIKTLSIELNSTTDNPIFDPEEDELYHCGNFQAVSVAQTMDQLRLSLQALGKIIFAQHSELVNKDLNNNLPANLCYKDPSLDFGHKGVDISMAAYMSELAWLAAPVTSHVQSAELHNQSINSLGLVSARQTARAIDILRMMTSCHLYSLCQALDLRCIEHRFTAQLEPIVAESLREFIQDTNRLDLTVKRLLSLCMANQNLSAKERFNTAFKLIAGELTMENPLDQRDAIKQWAMATAAQALEIHADLTNSYQDGSASELLGNTKFLYEWVRKEIQVEVYRGWNGRHGRRLQKIFDGIKSESILPALLKCMPSAAKDEEASLLQ